MRLRRGAGAVERGGLENRWACKRPLGSNPSPAAHQSQAVRLPRWRRMTSVPAGSTGSVPSRERHSPVPTENLDERCESLVIDDPLPRCGRVEVNNVDDTLQSWVLAGDGSYRVGQLLSEAHRRA